MCVLYNFHTYLNYRHVTFVLKIGYFERKEHATFQSDIL